MNEEQTDIITLAIDIGGSGVKAIKLDGEGKAMSDRSRIPTPQPPKPEIITDIILKLAKEQGEFERVSVGFPGVVRKRSIDKAVNLDPDWIGFDLATALSDLLGKPVRVANDADVQGLGAITGKGVELVVTLGTGFGSA